MKNPNPTSLTAAAAAAAMAAALSALALAQTAAHAGKLMPAQYRELATQIETEVGGIVAN